LNWTAGVSPAQGGRFGRGPIIDQWLVPDKTVDVGLEVH